jgi:hypothetical protein
MAYNPLTDFLGLMRAGAGGAVLERMPGLDFVVAALVRAGLFTVFVGQSPPLSNQATTVWFQPSVPSWVAEGKVWLWNSRTVEYELATPALWNALLAPSGSGYSFQEVAAGAGVILPGTTLLAVVRTAPAATALLLPSLAAQFATGQKLQIVDYSTAVTNHVMTLTTPDGTKIMQLPSWQLLSTADQSAGIMLQPSPDLNAWIIAP